MGRSSARGATARRGHLAHDCGGFGTKESQVDRSHSRPTDHALAGLFAGPLAACNSDSGSATTCTPECSARSCGDDGCGGTCGTCAEGFGCSAQGQCQADSTADPCDSSCAALGYACGDHCGVDCGACGPQEACQDHACRCAPSCSVATCEQPDGCGGTCAPCPRDATCSDCALALSVVERTGDDQRVREVTVALDFAPADGAPLPGMADLRFMVAGDAELVEVAIGQALLDAQKGLASDPETGRAFRTLSDGTLQIIVLSTRHVGAIPAGRWLFLKFRLGAADGASDEPVALRLGLVEREAIFAPQPADVALWGGSFGAPLVVWSDDVEVNHVP